MAFAPASVQRIPARSSRAPTTTVRPASTTPPDTHGPIARGPGAAHPLALRGHVAEAAAGLLARAGVGREGGRQLVEPSLESPARISSRRRRSAPGSRAIVGAPPSPDSTSHGQMRQEADPRLTTVTYARSWTCV
jgi:hypothetical protein